MNIPNLSNVFSRSIVPFRFVFILWLIFVADYVYGYHIGSLGVVPRNYYGLLGIVTGPLLHVNLAHILSNTFPLLILGAILFYFHYDYAKVIFAAAYLVPNMLVWIFARPIMHMGASGIIYAMATFLVVVGLLRRDFKSIIIAAVVMVLYSSLFLGVVGQLKNVSYEMHIAGIIVGAAAAIYFKKGRRRFSSK